MVAISLQANMCAVQLWLIRLGFMYMYISFMDIQSRAAEQSGT